MDITSLRTLSSLSIFGHCPPWAFLDIVLPKQFTDIVLPEQISDIVLPEQISDVVLPENFSDVVLPENFSDVFLPEKNSDIVRIFFWHFRPPKNLDIVHHFFENPIFVEVWRASHASNPIALLIKICQATFYLSRFILKMRNVAKLWYC